MDFRRGNTILVKSSSTFEQMVPTMFIGMYVEEASKKGEKVIGALAKTYRRKPMNFDDVRLRMRKPNATDQEVERVVNLLDKRGIWKIEQVDAMPAREFLAFLETRA